MQVIDCHVYSLSASAAVEEAGTGVQLSANSLLSITRSAVNFKPLYKDEFMKPNLPFTIKVGTRGTGLSQGADLSLYNFSFL